MKRIFHRDVRGLILAAAFFAGLGFGTSASAQAQSAYLIDLNSKTVTNVGTLGGTYIEPRGISDAGQWWVSFTQRVTLLFTLSSLPQRDG